MSKNKDYALLFARLVLGANALLHGVAETFGIWGAPHFAGAQGMAQQADVSPDVFAYALSIALIAGGALVLLGCAVKLVGLVLAALYTWHGIVSARFLAYFTAAGGCEDLLALLALCLVLATHGPGAGKVKFGGKQSG